jgi:hypothetical protein
MTARVLGEEGVERGGFISLPGLVPAPAHTFNTSLMTARVLSKDGRERGFISPSLTLAQSLPFLIPSPPFTSLSPFFQESTKMPYTQEQLDEEFCPV